MRSVIGARVLLPLALIGGATLVLTTALTWFATGSMIADARALDRTLAGERVRSAELVPGVALRALANDYAHWNDMAEFVAAPNDEFRISNFESDTFIPYGIDAVLITDAGGGLAFAGANESILQAWSPGKPAARVFDGEYSLYVMPDDLVETLRSSGAAIIATQRESSVLGWVPSDHGWLQVGVAAIGRHDQYERRDGLVFFARYMSEARMSERHGIAQMTYAIAPLDGRPAGVDTIDVVLADADHGPQARAVGEHVFVIGPTLEKFRWFAAAQQAAFVLVALLGIAWVVERRVVRRVESLRRGVEQLRDGRREALCLPSPDDELTALGLEFSVLLESLAEAQKAWRGAALTDSLTGLPNRSALIHDLDTAKTEPSTPRALSLIDLDGFKQVNDQFGHATGDQCLRRVALTMSAEMAGHGRLYRLGGDEFAAVTSADAEHVAQRLVAAVAAAVATDPARFGRVGASAGWVALDERPSVSDALAAADLAMYEAKRSGGRCVIAFTSDMRELRHENLSLEQRLREAVDGRLIRAVFQPIISGDSGELHAVEALARWSDEERGLVPPVRFIELAEKIGLVSRIDLTVLEQGLACLSALADVAPQCRLQVNLSPRSIDRPGIVEDLLGACRRAGVAPDRVTLEVTESAFASGAASPLLVLSSLREQGFGIALDDFGVGHSSLSRLARFAPDEVKIDGQFVRDLDGPGGKIVATIVALARQFGIRTTAEFVETDDQCRHLAQRGCDYMQGYGIAEPMSAEALAAWLRSR
jgi:diguanylate cyclase (GGDEF)-like protein